MASLVPEEEEMGILEQYAKYNPVTFLLQFLAAYGWYVVGAIGLAVLVYKKLKPAFDKYNLIQQDADHHKDPDRELSRMEAIQRAREKQQQLLEQASQRALEAQKEREERKRAERAEALEKYGAAVTGRKLGGSDDGYLPLSGGASASTYRPPKKSKCSGGGCGK